MEQLEAREVFSLGALGGLDCLPGLWTPTTTDTSSLASADKISPQQPTLTAKLVKGIEGTNLHDRINITRDGKNAVKVKIRSYTDPSYMNNSLVTTQQYSLANNTDFYGKLFVNGHEGNDMINVSWRVKFDTLIYGGRGHDKIYGSSGNNEIYGGQGNDRIHGRRGNDTIYGGHGNDKIYGGSGNDKLKGDFGNDHIWGDKGEDVIHGGTGHDRLYGGQHDDIIFGDPDQPYSDAQLQLAKKLGKEPADLWPAQFTIYGNDRIEGGSGHDKLYGGADNDTIDGGSGQDIITGGAGNDKLQGGAHTDKIWGGAGNDLIKGGSDFSVGDILHNVSLWLSGQSTSGAGDVLHGGAGNDTIHGDSGNDKIYGGAGNDLLRGGSGSDQLHGDKNHSGDTSNSVGNDKLYGDQGSDYLYGDAGHDYLQGDAGADYLYGQEGNDKLNGGSGGDELVGGFGNDKLWGGSELPWRRDQLWGDYKNYVTGSGTDTFYKGWRDVVNDKESKDTVNNWRWWKGSPF